MEPFNVRSFGINAIFDNDSKKIKTVILQKKQIMTTTKPFSIEDDQTDVMTGYDNSCQLIVWNDEVNTFDWVIETLIHVCRHTPEQAEQSAMIIHTKGKYAVKEGSYDTLKPMCDAITERGINATVEELSER
ncbi:MAG TPA: ATP-dependent Clp protease adaptor ClpS [Hanamia sp.]